MSDRPIQLDASFDGRPSYTILVWLRPRDASVNAGEPVAVVIDGEHQRVISAPCSGRIVSVYADEGAPIMPRAIIGMIRPSIILPDLISGSKTGMVAAAIIVITIALVAVANATPKASLIRLPAFPTGGADASAPTATGGESQPVLEDVAYPTPDGGSDATPNAEEPAQAPTTLPDSLPPATIDPAQTPGDQLPLVPTIDPDPYGTGVNLDDVRTKIIDTSRQAATLALSNRQYIVPGIIDDKIWQSAIQPVLTQLRTLHDQLTLSIDTVSNVGASQEVIAELQTYEDGIANCLDPYAFAETAMLNGYALSSYDTQFIQCQNLLESLPQQG